MSNSSIVDHMIKVIDLYEAKALRAPQVEVFLDQYALALEGISARSLTRVREQVARLVTADPAGGDAGRADAAALMATVAQLRAQVRSLLNESDPQILLKGIAS